MGTVVQFPDRGSGRFTSEMRSSLAQFAARARNCVPLRFGTTAQGEEFCCFANGLMIRYDRGRGLVLTDTLDGDVDCGLFHSLDDVCSFAAYLAL